MSSSIPFAYRIALDDRDVRRLRVSVRLAASAEQAARADTASLLLCFMQLAAAGGFANHRVQPQPWSQIRASSTEDSLTVEGLIAASDPRLARVLINALAAQALIAGPFASVEIEDGAPAANYMQLPPLEVQTHRTQYPDAISPASFVAQRRKVASYHSSRRALLEFVDDLGDELEQQVIAVFECWGRVAFGGFLSADEDLQTGNFLIVDATAQTFDDASVEVRIPQFFGSEAAWSPLINAIECNFAPVRAVAGFTIW